MKKLALIAVMLLAIPAVASAEVILDTDFESASLGLVVPQGIGGQSWGGSGAADVYIVDVGGAHGQVMAWQPTAPGNYRIFVDRTDLPTPVTYADGISYWEYDTLLATNQGDLTSSTLNEWGPISTHWFDPVDDDLDLYNGGPQWEYPDLTNVSIVEVPVTLDDWVKIRCEMDHATLLVDYYIDGVKVADDLAYTWFENNYLQWELGLNETFGDGTYMMVDNVKWGHSDPVIPEPSMIALGAFGLLALLRRKK